MRAALVNGSFDPVTLGHLSIIKKIADQYDRVYVGMLVNENKEYKFTLAERMEMLAAALADVKNAVPLFYSGTTIELCSTLHVSEIIRGVRTDADIEYDKKLMQGYDFSGAGISVRFVTAEEEYKDISSTLVRSTTDEKELKTLVPECVYELIKKYK